MKNEEKIPMEVIDDGSDMLLLRYAKIEKYIPKNELHFNFQILIYLKYAAELINSGIPRKIVKEMPFKLFYQMGTELWEKKIKQRRSKIEKKGGFV